MKNTLVGTALLFSFLLSGCSKGENTVAAKPVIVIKDCTGYYLRQGDLDYPVCNRETVESYKDGDFLEVAFTETQTCNTGPYTVCAMVHSYRIGQWVIVNRID